jgi:hypothetical protein
MQKYRADRAETQADGSTVWFAEWMGGPSLSKIDNCRLDNLVGDMRRAVYIANEADTFFSIPAVCKLGGCRLRGYVTDDDAGNYVFRHCYC